MGPASLHQPGEPTKKAELLFVLWLMDDSVMRVLPILPTPGVPLRNPLLMMRKRFITVV